MSPAPVATGNVPLLNYLGAGVATHLAYRQFEPKSPVLLGLVVVLEPLLIVLLSQPPAGVTISAVLRAYPTFYLSLVGSIVAYRLSPFHPLANVPGPTINKITQLWSIYIQSTGKQHIINKKLHDQYGPIIRVGPNEISVADIDVGLAVYAQNGLPKGRYYDARRDPRAPGNLLALVGDKHAERRRLWQRAFTSEGLAEHEVALRKRIAILLDALSKARTTGDTGLGEKQEKQGEVDLSKWFGWFTMDFMGDFCFGGGFELMRAGEDKGGTREMFDRFAIALAMLCHIPWAAPTLMKLPFLTKHILKLRKFGLDASKGRVKEGAKVKDLWYHLSDEPGLEPIPPPVSNVIADGALAMIAGADTTATGISSLFYLLLSHPEKLKRLRKEIDEVYPRDEDDSVVLESGRHGRLGYLNACLNETLRLLPPAPTNGPRELPRGSGGRMLGGRYIPDGTQIYVPPYSMHRNPSYFSPSPNSFIPERWLPNASSEPSLKGHNLIHNANAFIPFSTGPANCVGRALARREMMMLAAALLRRFDVEFAPGYASEGVGLKRWEEEIGDYFVSTRGPLWVVLKDRA